MKKFLQLSALLMAIVLMLVACTPNNGGTPTDTSGQGATTTGNTTGTTGNVLQSVQVPFFNNDVSYERGGVVVEKEEYLSYQAHTSLRHVFKDMEYHDAEMAAVRLAKAGVFEETENFEPNKSITVNDYVRGILMLAGKATKETSAADIASLAKSTGLIQEDAQLDFATNLTREWMAYLLDRASLDHSNALQYQLVHSDYETIDVARRTGVLQCLALGLWPIESKFEPTKAVTRAEAALTLYRLSNANMRLIPEYDLGDAYQEGEDTYLVKNTYELNEGGIQLGTYSDYNKQQLTFETFGKRPIDRVDFSKWVDQEPSKGVYSFPAFGNERHCHLFGSTVVTSVEVAANLIWNSSFHKSMIPSFYKQDITDPETRRAAKAYLYNWTQAYLGAVKGDVYVSLDYEVDWEMSLSWAAQECMDRAKIWGEWYVEACQVMRDAAKQAGAEDRLKLMVIYNNVTDLHKLGPTFNQWMLDCAEASDVVGIDIYFYGGLTDQTAASCARQLIQDVRFLINNYSLGKPVMVIENGTPQSTAMSEKGEELYYKTLFRELQFALDSGDFLNRNFNGYLFWSLTRTNDIGNSGVVYADGTLSLPGKVIQKEYAEFESINHYSPTKLVKTENVAYQPTATVKVDGGTNYEKLTLITNTKKGAKTLRIKLKEKASVCITVNGKYNYTSPTPVDRHYIEIPEGIVNGFNQIEIFFGNYQVPFEITVEAVNLK